MVEPLLYAALGFLIASLLALFMGRALWNRAVRLTTHRIMRRLPLSQDEIVASRDLLRAEQAIEHRRLERLANVMRQRMTQSMADVGRRDTANFQLRTAAADAGAKASAAEAREAAALRTIEELRAANTALTSQVAQTQSGLTEIQRGNKQLEKERMELVQLADTRRLDVAAAKSELAKAKLTAAGFEKLLEAARRELADLQASRAAESAVPAEDVALLRQQIEKLGSDLARAAAAPKARIAKVAKAPARPARGNGPVSSAG